jgi:membrane protein YqaA with SNARE-associated domain
MELLILFAWSFAAATILPLSSELPLAVEIARSDGWAIPVLVATLGNVLGAFTTYGLARAAITAAPTPSPRVARASAWLARYGPPILVLSWVPLIGDLLVGLAGATRMRMLPCAVWTTLGKLARYVAVALLVVGR